MTVLPYLILAIAAVFEVAGDAVIRRGLRNDQLAWTVAGMLILAAYGFVLNQLQWDFSRLLGVYVAAFALASVFTGWLVFRERIPQSTWAGLGLILAGAVVIQVGALRHS